MSDEKIAALIAELSIDHKAVDAALWCATDGLAWPCPTAQVVAALEATRQAPAVDREALAEVLAASEWPDLTWEAVKAQSDPERFRKRAGDVIASGILQDVAVLEREAEARGLEKAADFREALTMNPNTDMVQAWLRARAQQVREGNA